MSTTQPGKLKPIQETSAWQDLQAHAVTLATTTLTELFAEDTDRGSRFNANSDHIYFDFSKDHLTEQTLALLLELADTAKLKPAIERLFCGEPVNNTENRPALHTALRSAGHGSSGVEHEVTAVLDRMLEFAERVRQGEIRGATGKPFQSIVNIGIGGSDLGPRLVVTAFADLHHPELRTHFVANIDNDALSSVLAQCTAETTLFIVSSKSFSTSETLTNADAARAWLCDEGIPEAKVNQHFAVATANNAAALAWGINTEQVFAVGDWVGARFSLWSAIGLPIALALGRDVFLQLLSGAREMDKHFRDTAFADNLPVLHGLQAIWHINFRGSEHGGYGSRAVLPYIHRLRLLPDYLQQLMMESLGKSTTKTGAPSTIATGQVVWGSEGTNGQHSFHQLLLQGSELVSIDFIATGTAHCKKEAHQHLVANCLAQSQALMQGKSTDQAYHELLTEGMSKAAANELAAHKAVPGNRPSNILLIDQFNPQSLGSLLAFYEHSVYVQSVIWNINPFDQWGVELGKKMSGELLALLNEVSEDAQSFDNLDSSTRTLLSRLRDPGAIRKS